MIKTNDPENLQKEFKIRLITTNGLVIAPGKQNLDPLTYMKVLINTLSMRQN